MNNLQKILMLVSIALGLFFLYVDTRPTWDDAGILALGIATSCFVLGMAEPRRPSLYALCVGAWIPLVNIVAHHNFGSLVAMAFALAGAYAGMAARRLFGYAAHPSA